MVKFDFNVKDDYSLFPEHFEENDLVFFHGSPANNIDSISQDGFKSGKKLGISDLTSVSYARKSIDSFIFVCDARKKGEDMVVFVVRFMRKDLERPEVVHETRDIKVFNAEIQPVRIGYCIIPASYAHK